MITRRTGTGDGVFREALDVSRTLAHVHRWLPSATPVTVDGLTLAGYGPTEATSCTDLQVRPVICWDVNGYYRDLGVHWRADKKTLRRAYTARGGQGDDYLTYVFKSLLQPRTRAAYDAKPLGEQFQDRYVSSRLREQDLADARSAGKDLTSSGQDESLYDEGVDLPGPAGRDPEVWWHSYYLQHLGPSWDDTIVMRAWQTLLISTLRDSGHQTRFAVGRTGASKYPVTLLLTEDEIVFLLGKHAEVGTENAQTAARLLRRNMDDHHRA